jgi:uncharacterized protein (TIGR02001 family)
MRIRDLAGLLALAGLLPLAAPASAADLGGGLGLNGGATLTSDYRFRGISRSNEDPAIQGSLTLSHESGFYAGAWASSLDDNPRLGGGEVDLYGGWAGEIASGTDLDVGLTYYAFPDGEERLGGNDYLEPYARVSHTLGPVRATVGAAYAWSQAATGNDDNLYLFTDLSAGIPATRFTVKAHAGYSNGGMAPTGDYLDWSLGVDAVAGPVTLGVAYVDTDLGNIHTADGGILFTLGASF